MAQDRENIRGNDEWEHGGYTILSDTELKEYYYFFTDLWKFFKAHHAVKTDEEWGKVIEDAEDLAKKSPFKSESRVGAGDYEANNGSKIIELVVEELEELNKIRGAK